MTQVSSSSYSPSLSPNQPSKQRFSVSLRSLKPIFPFVVAEKIRILLALLALASAAILTLIIPLAVRRMVDFGFSAENSALVDSYFIMIVLLSLGLALAAGARYYLVMTIGERVVFRLRSAVFSHIIRLDAAFFDQVRTGEIISRLTADTAELKSTFGASASIALRNMILLFGALTMMIITSPHLSLLVVFAIPLIVFPLVAAGRGVSSRARDAQDRLADAAAFASERINAVRNIQSFNGENAAQNYFDHEVGKAYEAARKTVASRSFLTIIIIFIAFGSITFVLWTGAKAVITGEMSAGRLSQFVLYAVFAASSLGQISEVMGQLNQAAGAAKRLTDLLGIVPLTQEVEDPQTWNLPLHGQIKFDQVNFSYPYARDRQVLRGLNFIVNPGEKIAIVGSSGAGKSTIFQLLMRFYDMESGQILIDNLNIKNVNLHDLRAIMAFVPQDPVIFAQSIAENIQISKPTATQEEILNAAQQAGVTQFTDHLAQGLATMVGERGVTLSGGEKQRIAIARAILRDAPILLLDEATSALDAENERAVQEALDHAMQGRTALVIAHRLATIRNANRILVLDRGEIVEEGKHDDLIRQNGLYARLANLQFHT